MKLWGRIPTHIQSIFRIPCFRPRGRILKPHAGIPAKLGRLKRHVCGRPGRTASFRGPPVGTRAHSAPRAYCVPYGSKEKAF